MELDLHWWVRFVHVVAATIVLGGALLATVALINAAPHEAGGQSALPLAEAYEWVFWIAAPILIATGIGNLGAFGLGLPAPGTRWGVVLVTKLSLFLGLLAWSVVRTLAVVRALEGAVRPSPARWAWLYGVTSALGLGIVGYAEVLAHG